MGTITRMGGAAGTEIGIPQQEFTTCVHCQKTILFKIDMSSPIANKLDSDYRCAQCNGKPICRECGYELQATGKCPGPYRIRAKFDAIAGLPREDQDHGQVFRVQQQLDSGGECRQQQSEPDGDHRDPSDHPGDDLGRWCFVIHTDGNGLATD
jgi:hypothetical protein